VKCFCGNSTQHLQTKVFDQHFAQPPFALSGKRETSFSQPAGSTCDPPYMQRHLPPFHNVDRLVGVILSTQAMDQSRLAICLEPGSHHSGRLEIQTLLPDSGRVQHTIYERPIRLQQQSPSTVTLQSPSDENKNENKNDQQELNQQLKVIRLKVGDLFLFHPMLANRVLFEENLLPPLSNQPAFNILALQLLFGAHDVQPVQRLIDEPLKNEFSGQSNKSNQNGQQQEQQESKDSSNTITSVNVDWMSKLDVEWSKLPQNQFHGASLEEFDLVSLINSSFLLFFKLRSNSVFEKNSTNADFNFLFKRF
jgi:hypothetical protein